MMRLADFQRLRDALPVVHSPGPQFDGLRSRRPRKGERIVATCKTCQECFDTIATHQGEARWSNCRAHRSAEARRAWRAAHPSRVCACGNPIRGKYMQCRDCYIRKHPERAP